MAHFHLKISTEYEDASDELVESIEGMVKRVRDAIVEGFHTAAGEDGHEIVVTQRSEGTRDYVGLRQITEEDRIEGENKKLREEVSMLKQLLVDMEEVARGTGAPTPPDAITEDGKPYCSHFWGELLEQIRKEGYKPLLFLKDLKDGS